MMYGMYVWVVSSQVLKAAKEIIVVIVHHVDHCSSGYIMVLMQRIANRHC